MTYKVLDLENGFTKVSFESQGIIEEVYMETMSYESIKGQKLQRIKRKNVTYLYFFNEHEQRIYIHRVFAGATSDEYVYFINDDWRDLRKVNLIKAPPGSRKNSEFIAKIKELKQQQKTLNDDVLKKKKEAAKTSAKKSQPQLKIERDSEANEIIIENGKQSFSLKGMSDEQSLEIILKLAQSHLEYK